MTPFIFAGLPTSSALEIKKQNNNQLLTKVADAVCEKLNIDYNNLIGKSRKREFVEARQIAILIITENYPSIKLVTIARFFNRDHATIIYNRETCQDYIRTNKYFKAMYLKAKKAINS